MQLAQIDFEALEGETGLKFAGGNLGDIVSDLLPILFAGAGLLLLLYLLYGGLSLMLSRGDPKAVQGAKDKITGAVVGFVIVFVAYWIVQIVITLLGLQTKIGGSFGL